MAKRTPKYRVFAIRERGEGDDKKNFWIEIGAAWENKDGSLNLSLFLTPTDPNTTIQLRPPEDKNNSESPIG